MERRNQPELVSAIQVGENKFPTIRIEFDIFGEERSTLFVK